MVYLIYRDEPYELDFSKDYEFSRAMAEEHWKAGARNAQHHCSSGKAAKATESGANTFDLTEPSRAGACAAPGAGGREGDHSMKVAEIRCTIRLLVALSLRADASFTNTRAS